jgi:hypothetical protein
LKGGGTGPPALRFWPYVAHLPILAFLFAGALFKGQVFFFRDIVVYYYPNYVFLERSLRQGVWPLWNPTSDAGAPFLMADPADLLLVGLLGAERALRLGPPMHLGLAMAGASWLAAVLGLGRLGVWAAGLFYGLSGYVLSTANLFELLHATAWAPWVIGATLRLWEAPSRRRIAALALLGAVQVSTLGAETVLQTAVISLALLVVPPDRRRLRALAAAAGFAALLAAPALLGARALVADTARASGFAPRESFTFSLRPAALLDTVLPRFFGDPHTFSDKGFWGQPFFPAGYPYLVSLYCGTGLVWLAIRSSWPGRKTRLTILGLVGALLALGAHGPLEWLMAPLMQHFRAPPKFLFTSTLALCLLAARGLEDAAERGRRPRWWAVVPGAILCGLHPLLQASPDLPGRLFGGLLPEILDPRARYVIATAWPAGFGVAGALLLGTVLALRSQATAPLASVLLGLDLLIANGPVNLTAASTFYELRPAVSGLLESARAEGAYRLFAYGAAAVPDLRWSPAIARRNTDVWLYYVARQSLVPRTPVLDGVETAFDEDRVGWAPRGSTLGARERVPARYAEHHARLRLANVRFVVSFRPLPEGLVRLRGQADLPEVLEPLRFYELADPLPRAYRVDAFEVVPSAAALQSRLESPTFDPRLVVLLEEAPAGAALRGDPSDRRSAGAAAMPIYERLDPHTVRLTVEGPPGLVVVADGYHRDFQVEAEGVPRRLLRANGRYWALPSTGGGEVITVRYRPPWPMWAIGASALGGLGVLALLWRPPGRSRIPAAIAGGDRPRLQ